jgi:outer membrane protein OmpA-like peptidoglycan-associated protein
MLRPMHEGLFAALVLSVAAAGAAQAQPVDRTSPLVVAQAPPSEQDKEKAKRKEMERPKGPPPGEMKKAPPAGQAPPAGKNVLTPPDKGPPPGRDRRVPSAGPPGPPPGQAGKGVEPPMRKANEQPFERKKGPEGMEPRKQVIPGQPSPTGPKGPAQGVVPQPKGPGPSLPSQAGPAPGPAGAAPFKRGPGPGPAGPAGAAPRFGDVQKARKERVEEGGRRVIEEPGNRVIVKQGDRIVIRHDEAERFRSGGRDVKSERRPDGRTETFYVRPDGMRIVSVSDGNGRLLRRYRRGPDGREYNLIDNRKFYGTAVAVGVGAVGLAVALNLARPRVMIPREQYIVDYDRASDDDLYDALMAPPVEDLERAYSLEEVRDNYLLRDRMRRVDLDSINFEFGAWDVTPDQFGKLERVAKAMMRVLSRNPDEVFLIEGHTDAVGNDVDNLSLSDRRAEAVAGILSDTFGIPPENLVTQGYGKQFLKVDTPAAERINRRVAVRRITPLMSER